MTSTDLAPVVPFAPNQRAIVAYLGLNVEDPRSHATVAVCERYGLDPVLKHVIVIPKGGVYITRDGLLHIAHRSGQLDGIVLEDQGTEDGEHWAIVSVYRKDMRFPFRYRGRYSVSGSNKQYGPEMAVKCAEAMALRRAFDVAGLPVLEERHDQPRRINTSNLLPKPPAPAPVPADLPPGVDEDGVMHYDEADIVAESVDA